MDCAERMLEAGLSTPGGPRCWMLPRVRSSCPMMFLLLPGSPCVVLETCFRHQGLRAINVNLSLLYEGTSIGEGMNLGLGRIRYILAVLFVAVLCAAPAASSAEMVFELDPARSEEHTSE